MSTSSRVLDEDHCVICSEALCPSTVTVGGALRKASALQAEHCEEGDLHLSDNLGRGRGVMNDETLIPHRTAGILRSKNPTIKDTIHAYSTCSQLAWPADAMRLKNCITLSFDVHVTNSIRM